MTHSEACEILGLEQNADYVPSKPVQSVQTGKEQPLLAMWQEQGKILIDRAVATLWSPACKDMRNYLHGRGLGDEILKKKRWGYVPLQSNGKYYEADLETWGLDPATSSKDKVRIPNGILIPWFEGSNLWRLAIKRPGEKQSYGQVLGSGEGLYNVGEIQFEFPAMIVEGEICALSVEQEAGDLISCVATGSTTRGRLTRWVAELNLASHVLQSFDEDESGDSGSEYWIEHLKTKCQRWSPYNAKDPNDILLKKFFEGYQGCTLREWVEAGLMSIKKIEPPVPEATIPLARGRREYPIDLSKTQWHGPEVNLNEITIREWERGNLVAGICINKNCPCQEVWGKWVLEQALKKKK
jgi:hypothetical protein